MNNGHGTTWEFNRVRPQQIMKELKWFARFFHMKLP